MQAKCDAIREEARKSVEGKPEESCFGFAELCEAQAQLSRDASTSPIEALPMDVIMQQSEEWRVAALSMINLAFTWCILPLMWAMVPVAPVPKPGKNKHEYTGYRQISLFAGIMKLYDKLLQLRVQGTLGNKSHQWQGGGLRGADEQAWILSRFLEMRKQLGKARTWLAFLDGEAAYCRPPPEVILERIWRCGVCAADWLALDSILGHLWSCVKLGVNLSGNGSTKWGCPRAERCHNCCSR